MNDELVKDCWNKIGVAGDRACPQLKTVIHCRNCSVYASAGRALLQRESPEGYVEEWTNLLAQPLPKSNTVLSKTTIPLSENNKDFTVPNSTLIFRLEEEWFSLPIWAIKEVTSLCSIHALPHRSNDILLGIVNIRGEILICVSLSNLLGLKPLSWKHQLSYSGKESSPVIYQRMVVMEIQENRWVFIVDEIYSVQRIQAEELFEAPTVITKTPDTYTQKIINWQNKKVNFLNHELLFYELLFYTFARS